MSGKSSGFVGEIPVHYEQGLGPNIFQDYAVDIASRAEALSPANVLEMASGTGIVSRVLRDRLPGKAKLTVTDLNEPMLEIARRKFGENENVEFAPADAMALRFADRSFDLVVCQFGVMFFPDKVKAFREAVRVLRKGGAYLFNVWGAMTENPFSEITHRTIASVFNNDPPAFYTVPFSYHDEHRIIGDMKVAGFSEVTGETIDIVRTVPSWEKFAQGLVFGNPVIGELNERGVDPVAAKAKVAEALRGEFGREPASMPLRAKVFAGVAE